jgi:hypothetical protein
MVAIIAMVMVVVMRISGSIMHMFASVMVLVGMLTVVTTSMMSSTTVGMHCCYPVTKDYQSGNANHKHCYLSTFHYFHVSSPFKLSILYLP